VYAALGLFIVAVTAIGAVLLAGPRHAVKPVHPDLRASGEALPSLEFKHKYSAREDDSSLLKIWGRLYANSSDCEDDSEAFADSSFEMSLEDGVCTTIAAKGAVGGTVQHGCWRAVARDLSRLFVRPGGLTLTHRTRGMTRRT
jgi:hypothetical protein